MYTNPKNVKFSIFFTSVTAVCLVMVMMSFSISSLTVDDVPSISPIKDGEYSRISSGFGMRMHPVLKVEKFHGGMDFVAPRGTAVRATASGVVASAAYKKETYGKIIIIDHGDGYETRYSQLDDFTVEQGDVVSRGEIIGHVGSTGLSTKPHLHYEVRHESKALNPADFMPQ